MGFLKPDWMNKKNEKKALMAVERENSQSILAEIRVNAPLKIVRDLANNKYMSNLVEIAKNSDDYILLEETIKELSKNLNGLLEVAKNTKHTYAGVLAIKILADNNMQSMIIDIAQHAKNNDVRSKAVEKITDQNLLFL